MRIVFYLMNQTTTFPITDVKIMAPFKYLSDFWQKLEIPLINCEIYLILAWYENCVLSNESSNNTSNN